MKSIVKVFNDGQKLWKIGGFVSGGQDYGIRVNNIMSDYWIEKGIYEFINNPKYALIETLSKNKKTMDNFMAQVGNGILYEEKEKRFYLPMGRNIRWLTTQMLKGYWEEYIINRLREEGH